MSADDLNETGAGILLAKLYGAHENCVSDWASMGALMERHKVELQVLNDEQSEWDASVGANGETYYSSSKNPRLAIARVLLKKVIAENVESSYEIHLTWKRAFQLGLSRDDISVSVRTALSGGVLNEDENVLLELKADF